MDIEAKLISKIRAAGLRSSDARLEVFRLVYEATMPLSHGEVVARIGDARMNASTVFRCLKSLIELGVVRTVVLGDRVLRYVALESGCAHTLDAHPHFVCRECRMVQCLVGTIVEAEFPRSSPRSLQQRQYDVQIRGVCDECRLKTSVPVQKPSRTERQKGR